MTKFPIRLSEAEAINLARNVVNLELDKNTLLLARTIEKDKRIVWEISSATIGSQLIIEVDDATGHILEARYIGIR